MPLSLPHHAEGPGAQLLSQEQLAVLDQTRQTPTATLLTLSWAASAPLLPAVRTAAAYHLRAAITECITDCRASGLRVALDMNSDVATCFRPWVPMTVISPCCVSEPPIIFFVLEKKEVFNVQYIQHDICQYFYCHSQRSSYGL